METMARKKVLLLTGGIIHDWQGCGDEIERTLTESGQFDLTRVNDDLSVLVTPNLDPYEALVFYWTRGELADDQLDGLLKWLESGRGFVGVHSATASFWECAKFHEMLGGMFRTHPKPREYLVEIVDAVHPITSGVSDFSIFDEQYVMEYDPGVHVLASADLDGEAIPAAWTKSWGGGRVYYLALGHDAPACRNEGFGRLLINGLVWALGEA